MPSARAVVTAIRGRQAADADAETIAAELAALGNAPEPELSADDALKHFLSRLKINNIEVLAAGSRSEAVKRIGRFIYTEHNSYRAVAGYDRRLAAMPWRDGGVLVRFGAADPEDAVSISYAHCGIAETGSLLLYSNRDNPAANTWLCLHHLVLLDVKDLLISLKDGWAKATGDSASRGIPRGVHFISGPSSTGDIVGHLVTGAHGPQRLILILLGHIDEALLNDCGHPQPPVPD